MALIREGMIQVVAGGTANHLRLDAKGKLVEPQFKFAGKTGTAQVKRITERERDMGITQDQLPWHLRHHALFVCFGPVDNPRYACAVIIEHGKAGGATARPDRPRRADRGDEARPVAPHRRLPQDGVALRISR